MAAIACWLECDNAGFGAAVGSDEEAAVLLPVSSVSWVPRWSSSPAQRICAAKCRAG